MKKFSAIVLAIALSLSAASGFAKDKGAHAACKGLKGKERTECVKSEKAKKAESKMAPAAKAPAAGASESK